jgi:hypothetical protein
VKSLELCAVNCFDSLLLMQLGLGPSRPLNSKKKPELPWPRIHMPQ